MRTYLSLVPNQSIPTGPNLFLECLLCGEVVQLSMSKNARCTCQNIRLDAEAGRIAIRDWNKIKLFEET
jgi:hypothetical protein